VRLIGVFSVATLIALAFQTTVTRLLPFDLAMPNLVLILAVTLGLRYYSAAAALMAFGIGYATDTFSGSQLGLNALLFSLVFILTYGISRLLISSTNIIGVVAVFAGVIFTDMGQVLATANWTGGERMGVGLAMPPILFQAAITALCAPLVFNFMGEAARLIGLRQRSLRD
jgi:rod shape-determining protein MreD